MSGPDRPGFDLTVDPDDLVDEPGSSTGGVDGVGGVDPQAVLEDYAELARLLRAADSAGDRLAVGQIRDQMDELWPALNEEQRARIEDGEFDW
jgi:hypothetical protein